MLRKKTCIAMLLAGGQGSRLGILTKNVAKPAVPYGGKYRIIDFPLSNCTNSGIDTVGVLTQYQPLELNAYIGSGAPWDLDISNGGVFVLPPYQKGKSGEWYRGTANAIYQNMAFIEQYHPDYVLILSGDHIYKMDYNAMLDYHIRNGADSTIAVREVPWEEASRFGIMNTNSDNRIIEFEEKPKNPKSNKASMGVYIFTWEKLRKYLTLDEEDKNSSNDFGKNIIPDMLNDKQVLMAYDFNGYWKDVGTIESLWEANMDILSPASGINLNDPHWKIYARSPSAAPQYIADGAEVGNSMVTEGCSVEGKVDFSVLFPNATIEEGANIKYSIIMPGAVVKKGADVQYAIVAENAVIEENAKVGAGPDITDPDKWGVAVIGEKITIGKGAVIPANVMVNENVEEGTNYESK